MVFPVCPPAYSKLQVNFLHPWSISIFLFLHRRKKTNPASLYCMWLSESSMSHAQRWPLGRRGMDCIVQSNYSQPEDCDPFWVWIALSQGFLRPSETRYLHLFCSYEVAMKTVLWLGVTTAWGTVLKRHRIGSLRATGLEFKTNLFKKRSAQMYVHIWVYKWNCIPQIEHNSVVKGRCYSDASFCCLYYWI